MMNGTTNNFHTHSSSAAGGALPQHKRVLALWFFILCKFYIHRKFREHCLLSWLILNLYYYYLKDWLYPIILSMDIFLFLTKYGPLRELNPGPPAPEAGIIPLDQVATGTSLPIEGSYKGAIHSIAS